MTPPSAVSSPPAVPPIVTAAQEYLRFAEQVRSPMGGFDGARHDPKDLTAKEQAVYDAALDVLRLYFTGEQTYEPAAPPPAAGDGNSGDPKPPVAV